jgi:hypothetical protein
MSAISTGFGSFVEDKYGFRKEESTDAMQVAELKRVVLCVFGRWIALSTTFFNASIPEARFVEARIGVCDPELGGDRFVAYGSSRRHLKFLCILALVRE